MPPRCKRIPHHKIPQRKAHPPPAAPLDRLARAQLVLAVFDGSEPLDADDLLIAEACKEVPVIALVNKRDLPRKMDLEPLKQRFERLLVISADQPDDLELLKREIEQLFSIGVSLTTSRVVPAEFETILR